MIVANKIFEGERRKSGEIGHMTIIPKAGDRCYCGQRGCFDTVCRANVLAEYADGDLEKFFELLETKGSRSKAPLEQIFRIFVNRYS